MIAVLFRGILFTSAMAWYSVGVFKVIDEYFKTEIKKQLDTAYKENKYLRPDAVLPPTKGYSLHDPNNLQKSSIFHNTVEQCSAPDPQNRIQDIQYGLNKEELEESTSRNDNEELDKYKEKSDLQDDNVVNVSTDCDEELGQRDERLPQICYLDKDRSNEQLDNCKSEYCKEHDVVDGKKYRENDLKNKEELDYCKKDIGKAKHKENKLCKDCHELHKYNIGHNQKDESKIEQTSHIDNIPQSIENINKEKDN